jgi:hypothetical protein
MKKLVYLFFAAVMMFSMTFISGATSSNDPFSVQAQTGQVTVKRKRTGGIVGGTKYIAHKTKRGVKYVAHKTVRGTVYAGKKTYQGGKYVGKKTVKVTKYTAHKTKRGTKAVISRTKKIVN